MHPQFQISSWYFIKYNISWEMLWKGNIPEMRKECQMKLIKKLESVF